MYVWIHKISLQYKIAGIIIIFVLGPIAILGVVGYIKMYNVTLRDVEGIYVTQTNNVMKDTESILKQYEKSIESFYNVKGGGYSFPVNIDEQMELRLLLEEMRKENEWIAGIGLIFQDGTELYSNAGYIAYYDITRLTQKNMELYRKWQEDEDIRAKWFVAVDRKNPYVVCSKTVKNIYKNEVIGTMVLYISTTIFVDIERTYSDNKIIIADESNYIIWSNISEELKEKVYDEKLDVGSDRMVLYGTQEHEFFCIAKKSAYNEWNYLLFVPREEVYGQMRIFTSYFIAVIGIIVIFMAMGIFFINRNVSKPIQRLIVIMNHVDTLDKINLKITTNREDEIGYLYKTYSKQNQRIATLIKELEEAYIKDKEKEIKLLQNQMNPHFIYNTLDCIGWSIYVKNIPEVSEVLYSLSTILRYSVKEMNQLVCLKDELEMLKCYISIQRFRVEERFDVVYDVDETLLWYKTIKFTFQPFVENAFIHAFKDMDSDCMITIKLREDGDNITIHIEDNGGGISQKTLNMLNNFQSDGIGINNVNRSMILQFGEEHSVKIESTHPHGTRITLVIPKIL